jgi:hypothetical protein
MEKQKAMFNELVSHVTELCFDKCVAALRSPRSDGSSGSNVCRQQMRCQARLQA